tara:strand:+ start:809 stop:1243 length:435 start_codon:yes stop_codon:yes gene_type:complete
MSRREAMSGEYINVTIGASNWGNYQNVLGASALEVQSWENSSKKGGKRQVFLKLSPQGKQPMSWVQVDYDSLLRAILISEVEVATPIEKRKESCIICGRPGAAMQGIEHDGWCWGCVRNLIEGKGVNSYGKPFPDYPRPWAEEG